MDVRVAPTNRWAVSVGGQDRSAVSTIPSVLSTVWPNHYFIIYHSLSDLMNVFIKHFLWSESLC
jgi:hypothetical protein